MNEQEIDKSVRELFLNQKLSAEKVQSILDQGKSQRTKKPFWMSYWMPVAAAAAIAMVFSFEFSRNYQDEEFYFDVAGEIAMRHDAYSNFDVRAASFSDVQAGLKDLAFSVTPVMKQKLLSAYEVIGARYCQLQGQQAAHLQVKNRKTGALCTLYVASMSGSLSTLKSIDQHVGLEAHEVDIWEDSDRLFALVD